jgi:hypothetical protein
MHFFVTLYEIRVQIAIVFTLLLIILPLLSTHIPLPSDLCGNPVHAAHYHLHSLYKVWWMAGFIADRALDVRRVSIFDLCVRNGRDVLSATDSRMLVLQETLVILGARKYKHIRRCFRWSGDFLTLNLVKAEMH